MSVEQFKHAVAQLPGVPGGALICKEFRRGIALLSTETVGKYFAGLSGYWFLLVGGLVGLLAWGGGPELVRLMWLLVLPLAWGVTPSRWSAGMLMLGYYLIGARGLPGGTAVFFGEGAPIWFGIAMWAAAGVLLTVPFVLLWSSRRGTSAWRFVGAVCISAIPPLAIIGWVSPLAVAGVMYPGLGWIGAVLTMGVMATLVNRCRRWGITLAVMAVMANGLTFFVGIKMPTDWAGVDTEFSRLSSAGSDDAGQVLAAMRRVEWVKAFAATVPAHSVRVLPETVLGPFDGVADFSLRETERALRARGSRVLVGAELPQSNGQYKNVLLVLGASAKESRYAVQNIPVPVSMWKPWAADGAVGDVFGRGNLVAVNGVRASAVICYEQLLAFSLLWTMASKPDALVAVSNVWWAKQTSIPDIQRQMVASFGRLFGVAVVSAINS